MFPLQIYLIHAFCFKYCKGVKKKKEAKNLEIEQDISVLQEQSLFPGS